MDAIEAAARTIEDSDALIITAANGLSISEGLHIFDQSDRFRRTFPEANQRLGIRCILEGCSFGYPSEEERWGFWSHLIGIHALNYSPSEHMRALRRIAGDKPHFVVTTNTEGHFTMSGFAEEDVFELEGNWRTMQCERGCHDTIYPSLDAVAAMAKEERGSTVPKELIPRCPECGGPMCIRFVANPAFIADDGQERFSAFLERYGGSRVTVLELGMGSRNGMIKAPMMNMVARNPGFRYITVNLGDLYIPSAIGDRSIGIDGDVASVLKAIAERMGV